MEERERERATRAEGEEGTTTPWLRDGDRMITVYQLPHTHQNRRGRVLQRKVESKFAQKDPLRIRGPKGGTMKPGKLPPVYEGTVCVCVGVGSWEINQPRERGKGGPRNCVFWLLLFAADKKEKGEEKRYS